MPHGRVAYLLARTAEGQHVFHLSHVASLEVTERTFGADEGAGDHDRAATFGVWTGPDVLDICLRIRPPAARNIAVILLAASVAVAMACALFAGSLHHIFETILG